MEITGTDSTSDEARYINICQIRRVVSGEFHEIHRRGRSRMPHLSYHAGTAGKVQKKQVKSSLRHTQRKTYGAYQNHGNKDIDKKKTKYNLDYEFQKAPVQDVVEDRLENSYKGKRAVRKDAVVIREIIAQPSSEVFIGMTVEEQQEKIAQFVKDAKPWLEKEFGKKNLLGASAHLDETNPHVHFMVMPLTKDGRLSQKDFFKGPGDFQRQHRQFREHMNKKGWAFDLSNKYESAEGVSLNALKENGEEVEENRVKLTNKIRENKKLAKELAETPEVQKEALDMAVQEFRSGDGAAVHQKMREELEEEFEEDRKLVAERFKMAERMVLLAHEGGDDVPKLPARTELKKVLESETDGRFSIYLNKKSQESVLVDLQGEKPRAINQGELIRELTTATPDGKGGAELHLEGNAAISYVLGYYSSEEAKTARMAHQDGLEAIAVEQNEMALEMEKNRTL